MKNIAEILEGVKTMGIGGHIRPDGDCVGSCMALYLYVKTYYPEIQVDVYLDNPKPVFGHIDCIDEIKTELDGDKEYDLFVTCDVSSRDRLALVGPYFDTAKKTACIDHHISNPGFAQINHVRGEISSACEVLYGLLDPEKVIRTIAVPIYTGMIHDTGVFQYSCTSAGTMQAAGILMEKGINFSKIVDETYYQKTFHQNQILGRALLESITFLDGKAIVSVIKKDTMNLYEVTPKDLDGIVNQLRVTKGVECAIFMYEVASQQYKVSLRSNELVDVSKIAMHFGGGGHVRAAGCEMNGNMYDVINNLSAKIEEQIEAANV